MKLIPLFLISFLTVFSHIAVAKQPALPLTSDSAAQLMKDKTKGKVLSVDKNNKDGSILFQVKVLHPSGKVKVYTLDATSGKQK